MKFLVFGLISLTFCNSLNAQKFFDLSHDYGNDTINWPGATRITVKAAHQGTLNRTIYRLLLHTYIYIFLTKIGYVDPNLPDTDANNFW